VIAGTTAPVGRAWTRRIAKDGRITTIAPTMANYIKYFPDGDVYMGITSDGPAMKTSYAKKIWSATGEITDYDIGLGGGLMMSSFAKWIYTSTGEVFLFDNGRLNRMFPTFIMDVTNLSNALSSAASNDDLIIAGTTKSGVNRLIQFNLLNRTEKVLIDESDEIEMYHVRWSEPQGRVYFDGLRFSDNKYVIGSVEVATKQVLIAESSSRIGVFETFSS
jgi:hypothetical protein